MNPFVPTGAQRTTSARVMSTETLSTWTACMVAMDIETAGRCRPEVILAISRRAKKLRRREDPAANRAFLCEVAGTILAVVSLALAFLLATCCL